MVQPLYFPPQEVPDTSYSPEQLEELYLNSDLHTQSLYFPSQELPETVYLPEQLEEVYLYSEGQ